MNEYYRKCPKCDCEITYTNKYSCRNAEKKKSKCKSCGLKSTMTEERIKQMSERVKGENNPMYGKKGDLNPFYGKKHTEESKRKIIENKDYSTYKKKEFRDKMSKISKGENNPMYGRSFYDIWLDKYGKEIADQKMLEFREKISKQNKGENNPMYGKPSPNGSGNGWSGWYNDWFFRSIRELTYMIKVIERFNLKWESGEINKWKIQYEDYDGSIKNYFPDFIIENKYMVEIKPKNLWYSKNVILKKEAAIQFCYNNNLIYKLSEIPILSEEEITCLYDNKKIIFTEKYEQKYSERYKK